MITNMKNARVGFAICGSFCTFEQTIRQLELLIAEGADVIPIMSAAAYSTDTRFGAAAQIKQKIEQLCKRKILHDLNEVEPIGPKALLDILIVEPCTGNTLGKLACGIYDSAVTLAVKAQLRNERPVLLAISTNDGLSGSAKSIGELQCRRNIYFVPYRQDDPFKKPTSLVADFDKTLLATRLALESRQLQPMLL